MRPQEVVWELDAHSHGKHEVLRRYLTNAWFPIVGSFAERIAFIDGFAGPGEYKRGEKGSPQIALEAFAPYASRIKEATFLFIEEDAKRAAHLKGLIESQHHPPSCRIVVKTADFNEHMTKTLDGLRPGRQLAPAFVMADPFGVSDTPMSLFSRILLKTGKAELYVSVMYEFIERFKATPEFHRHLTDLYGTDTWRDGLHLSGDAAQDFFLGLYKAQLKKAGAKHVVRFDLYEGARLVYAIFFATQHPKGADRMKEAIWKVTKFGDFAYRSAHHDHGQLTLSLDPDLSPLRVQLRRRFSGKGPVTIEALETFVASDETDFYTGQLRRALAPLEQDGLIEVTGQRSKRLTYPAGKTTIRFL